MSGKRKRTLLRIFSLSCMKSNCQKLVHIHSPQKLCVELCCGVFLIFRVSFIYPSQIIYMRIGFRQIDFLVIIQPTSRFFFFFQIVKLGFLTLIDLEFTCLTVFFSPAFFISFPFISARANYKSLNLFKHTSSKFSSHNSWRNGSGDAVFVMCEYQQCDHEAVGLLRHSSTCKNERIAHLEYEFHPGQGRHVGIYVIRTRNPCPLQFTT